MKVISYNLRKHRAAGELAHLVAAHGADVLCLQEADTSDIPEEIEGLRLADATQRNRLGLAVYYRENTYRAWMTMRTNPRPPTETPRHHRLKGGLAHGTHRGRTCEQWQIEVTGAGRVWYLLDTAADTRWITFAGTGHPRATDRR